MSDDIEGRFAYFILKADRETFAENGVKPSIYERLFPNNAHSTINIHVVLSETFPHTITNNENSIKKLTVSMPYSPPSIEIEHKYITQGIDTHCTITCNPAGKNMAIDNIKLSRSLPQVPLGIDFQEIEVAEESDYLAIFKTVGTLAKQQGLIRS